MSTELWPQTQRQWHELAAKTLEPHMRHDPERRFHTQAMDARYMTLSLSASGCLEQNCRACQTGTYTPVQIQEKMGGPEAALATILERVLSHNTRFHFTSTDKYGTETMF